MIRRWFPFLLLLIPATAVAQVAPGAFSTLRSTDITGASMCVGCPIGSTTPADNSGITATTVVLKSNVGAPSVQTNKLYNISGALYFNGLSLATGSSISGTIGTVPKFTGGTTLGDSTMTISGANFTIGGGTFTAGLFSGSGASLTSIPAAQLTGSHTLPDGTLSTNVPLLNINNTFSGTSNMFTAAGTNVQLGLRNTTAGTTNTAIIGIGNDADAIAGYIKTNSSTFTTSGFSIADSTEFVNERTGGILINSASTGNIRIALAGVERGRMFTSGGFSWGDTTDPGATNMRVAGTLTVPGGVTANLTGNSTGTHTGAVVGNASTATSATTAGTVTTAAQTAITSLGILTSLAVGTSNPGNPLVNIGFSVGTPNSGLLLNAVDSGASATYAAFNIGGTLIGSITRVGSTSAVAFNTTSDARLKRDLGIASDLSGLRSLRIHDFRWKSDGTQDRGVFAQEAYGVMARGVTPGGDLEHPWSVDYSKYVPDVIAGWQQHDATITALEARIAALEATIATFVEREQVRARANAGTVPATPTPIHGDR